ncbi:CRAL/TRIO domain-containing protein [Massarina eburnea CBS 473.64]|uniref:CRAL/TRIO domain-containing protein n=1 Tax=Massarina eburnea CBS 473.64 TaxID=1395130 RepID=A0A6A6S0X6_9PLEO|nr:CRAL/TRIO domain-containing protein [Massarina eburnea CBS 473.64]
MADLARVESFQYPSGHYAHLSDNQQAQLELFKQLSQKEGYYTPVGTDGKTEASHDDETLLRFLRARRFLPSEAFKQFKETEDWRKENGIQDLFHVIEVEEFEQTRRLYPQWLGRRDKRGIPVFVFEVAPLNSKNISTYEKDMSKARTTSPKVATKNLRLFALYESLTRFVLPLCSAIKRSHPETPISQSNNIVDISGVGLKQFWNLKNHMQDASQLATAHYPETLDRIFIIGAPAFFPTVWGWVKRWFDPITVSKIFILSPANVFPTLSQYIDPDNIPKKYGGNMDFTWGDMPSLEPEIEAAIKWELPATQNGKNTFPIGPITWERGTDGSLKAVAVGHEKGQPRRKTTFTIPNPVGTKAEGPPVVNTPVDEAELRLTTVGSSTHPPDSVTYAATIDSTPPLDSPTLSATPTAGAEAGKGSTLPIREGTSDTRYEQQHMTHASGQLSDGTPQAAVNDHGHGDKTVTMEPGTVGQAPKDVSIPPAEPPAPGYIEQAKSVAATATSTVTSTVGSAAGAVTGLVGGNADTAEEKVVEKSAEQKALDKEIDGKGEPAVEGFLREKTASEALK